jgi:hypothetical protein
MSEVSNNAFMDAVPVKASMGDNEYEVTDIDSFIKLMYERHVGPTIIAMELNRRYKTTKWNRDLVRTSLRHSHAKIRNRIDAAKRYSLDENFFSEITTEEQAYVLGWIWSDGNIYTRERMPGSIECSLNIVLSEKDIVILELIKNALKADNAINEYIDPRTSLCYKRLHIYSKKIFDDLVKLGCLPNKSLKIKPPVLSNNLMQHFWRGVMDGDGHIRASLSPLKLVSGPEIEFFGSISMTIAFRNFIGEYIGKYAKIDLKNIEKNARVRYHDLQTIKEVINILEYKNAQFFLERKRNRALIILNYLTGYPTGAKPDTYLTKEEAILEERSLEKRIRKIEELEN